MQQIGQSLIQKLTNPTEVLIVNLNYSEKIFKDIFSKMEFTTAVEYLLPMAERLSIPSVYTIKDSSMAERSREFHSYIEDKSENRAKHVISASPFDDKFMSSFGRILPSSDKDIMHVPGENIFLGSNFLEYAKEGGVDTLLFTGFFTEFDVYVSAIEAQLRGYYSFVVSDATSTYSERIFYEALDLMSQVIEVIDTRDLMKIWGE